MSRASQPEAQPPGRPRPFPRAVLERRPARASGQLFVVSVSEIPLADPRFELTPVPVVTDSVRSLSRGKGRNSREDSDAR